MKKLLALPLLVLTLHLGAQPFAQNYFRSPLDIKLFLAGNFAELRPNHFHSGLDFKTQGAVGKNVYAAARGFVSRISVSPSGYGKAVYIDHPNGYTTVYAHLMSFSPAIDKAIKEAQYKQQKFKLNVYLKPESIPVAKGELIGLSGNSGSSGGPHLHFEIRDTDTEHPYNPLLFGFQVEDNVAPVLYSLFVYPVGKQATVNGKHQFTRIPLNKSNGVFVPARALRLYGKIGFGLHVHDFHTGSRNRCGVYSLLLQIDDQAQYSFKMVEHGFDETRYINAHIDYENAQKTRAKIHKTFILPNNQLQIYDRNYGNGIFDFKGEHTVAFTAFDVYGNKSSLRFVSQPGQPAPVEEPASEGEIYPFNQVNYIIEDNLRAIIPKDALYADTQIAVKTRRGGRGFYSPIYAIHNGQTPLHKKMDLSIRPVGFPEDKKDKACIVKINGRGRRLYYPANWINGFVCARVKYFGQYAVGIDNAAPRITALTSATAKSVGENSTIAFRVQDAMSGIKTIEARINGVWKLYEWDAKRSLVELSFEKEDLKGRELNFSLRAIDYLGNENVYRNVYRVE